jgi:prolyl-tRNA synthetase
MGCYGVGISRILGAVAEHKADDKGLAWPRAIAPFDVVVMPTSGSIDEQTMALYDRLVSETPFEVALDDRKESFGWKMRDADMTGYPVAVILGKAWRERGMCEVQCRSLGVREDVPVEQLSQYLHGLLQTL